MSDWLEDEGLMETFRAEVNERLESLSQGLLALETRPGDSEVLGQVFRDAHTVKGSARMMGFTAAKEVAHRMEDVLGDIKEGRLSMTPAIADVLLAGVDLIPQLLGPEGLEDSLPPNASDLVRKLESVRGGALAPTPPAGAPRDWPPRQATPDPSGQAPRPGPAPVSTVSPSPGSDRPAASLVSSPVAARHAPTEVAKPPAPPATPAREAEGEGASSIRIDSTKVYELIDHVGESSVAHVRSAETVRAMAGIFQALEKRLRRLRDPRGVSEAGREAMADAFERLSGLLDDLDDAVTSQSRGFERLQEQAMRLAMLPTSSIFAPYPRIVRDLCRDLGKEVDLHMDGGGTELDKQVLERIVDPLRHLLINAVDHGIELPDERAAASKPRRGTVSLRARHKGRQVVMEIEDDGRGIDPEQVREAARRRGLLQADEELSDAEVLTLLFTPGFSTTRLVTDLSGRGVGLDIVKTAVDQLKGTVEIHSVPGKGTRFSVTVPTTLAIVEAVMITCGGQVFAVPVASVEEVVAVPAHEISTTGGRETAVLRGRTTPVVALHRVLDLRSDERQGPVIVITTATRRVAFRVGAVLGQREVVVKGLGSFIPKVRHIAGATISADGTVQLVLDPADLVETARRVPGPGMAAPVAGALELQPEGKRLLVIDDSLAIREMNRSILETAGYRVETANDGYEGLSRLSQGGFDGVLTDVEMPRMDGFELTTHIRGDPTLSHLPVIILTSLVREEDQRRGLEAGADAYLTKSGFDQSVLIGVLEGLLRAGGRRL